MEIPSDVFLQGSIKQGVVYYFKESSFKSDDFHFFVVLNRNPRGDAFIYFVNATSKVEKAYDRITSQQLPEETLVFVQPAEFPEFKKMSVFDCNSITKKHEMELRKLIENGALSIKGEIPKEILLKLLKATKASPLVERRIKKKI